MKKIALLLTLLPGLCLHAQWRNIYKGADSTNPVASASFFSPSGGFIATNKWIGLTADSGYTYQQLFIGNGNVNYEGDNVDLTFGFLPSDIQAYSSSSLLVSGNYGYEPSILYSSDGGSDWQLVYHRNLGTNAASNSLYQLAFPGNSSTGYGVQNNEIIKTTNSGQSWITVSATNGSTFALSAPDVNTVYVASSNTLYKTTNGGTNWTFNTVPFTIQSMTAYSDTHVYAMTPVGDTYSSLDGGVTWQKANSVTGQFQGGTANYLHFTADSIGFACAGAVYQTRNSGMSWELMPGSGATTRLTDWNKLVFYTNQQIWLPGWGEQLDLTTNGGGISYPRALFDVNTSLVCAANTVQLVNQGQPGEGYAWYRNRVLFATTYNASYTAPTGNDTIKLVVSNNGMSDSVTRVVTAASLSTFALSSGVQDSACSNTTLRFFIYNSDPSIIYQVKRPCCSPSSQIPGTGGTFSIPYYLNAGEDSASTFTVYAYRTTSCSHDTASQSWRVTLQIPNPPTSTLTDTICGQDTFYITVTNSRVGYQYWAGSSTPFAGTVAGTGGAIRLPCVAGQASTSTNIDSYGFLKTVTFPIYVSSVSAESCGPYQVAMDTMVSRYPRVKWWVEGYAYFTGEPLQVVNASQYATNYLWTGSAGISPDSSTLFQPTLSFSSPGYNTVSLKDRTLEGCVDSLQQVVDIYGSDGAVPGTAVCPSGRAGNVVDSLNGGRYLVDRAIFEDGQGNRVLAGGFTTGGAAAGNEGWWAVKYDKSGNQQWFLYQNELDYYSTYYYYPHIVIEQAVGDSAGNTYLMGHEMNQQYVTAVGEPQTAVQSMADFLIKVSAAGHILWVKPFNSMDGSNIYQFCSGGSLLLGKGGTTLYVIAQRYPGSSYVAGSTTVLGAGVGHEGVIMQFDLNGNLLRDNSFQCPPVNLYNPILSSTANFWHVPPASFVNGNLVIYTTLYPSQTTVENAAVGFSSTTIPGVLVVWDTTSLHALKVLPVYSTVTGSTAGVTPVSYAMDSTGAYYADYNGTVASPAPAYPYNQFYDSTQIKTYIEAFSPSGTILWTKIADGLEPERMYASGGQLKVCGTNYPGLGYTDGGGTDIGEQPTFDSTTKRLTVVGNIGSNSGRGGHGIGSLDIIVATLQTTDGTLLDYQALGSKLEDERMVMVKGAGNQLWVAGSVGSLFLECCGAPNYALYTYKIPITNDCYGGYPGQAPFLKWNVATDSTACTDSLYTLGWSSTGTGTVSIRFSKNNGVTYTPLATGLQPSSGSYTFNAISAGTLGKVLFIITDDDSASLADTTVRQLAQTVASSVSITASDSAICAGTPVRFTALAVNGGGTPAWQWLDGTTVVGTNADTVTLNGLKNKDMVQVKLTGSAACSSPAVAVSNTITMTVTTGVAPTITLGGTVSELKGRQDTLDAHAMNAGPAPVYSWQDSTASHSWALITGMADSILYYTPADSGDRVRCTVTGAGACSPVDSAMSNTLVLSVLAVVVPPPPDSTGAPADSTGSGQLYLFPDPAASAITIDTLRLEDEWQTLDILDMTGRELVSGWPIAGQTIITVPVGRLSKGIYIVRMNGRKRKANLRFLKL
jgi:photosystem II stability/assembly factor-like uncharacterized protein